MKMTTSIELVWQLAGQEALAADFSTIQPEHFLMALLKLTELPFDDIHKVAGGEEVARELAQDAANVREEFERRSVNTKHARRTLRSDLGTGDGRGDDRELHRSDASRCLFDSAAQLADKTDADVLVPQHLFLAMIESPTPLMKSVLGSASESVRAHQSETPLLHQYGRDLCQLAVSGKLQKRETRDAEHTALLQVLSEEEYRGVLLVSDEPKVLQNSIETLAIAITSGEVPSKLHNKCLIDVASTEFATVDEGSGTDLYARLVMEAASSQHIILVDSIGDSDGHMKYNILKKALTARTLQCILQIRPSDYSTILQSDRNWKRLVHVMWLGTAPQDEIPTEL